MVAIVAFLSAVALIIQLPKVQTFMVEKVVKSLDDKMDADITFEKIHFRPFRTLVVKNIVIVDKEPVLDADDSTSAPVDTFFRAEYITAKFTLKGLIKQEGIHLNEVTVSNALMNLVLEDKIDTGDGDTSTDNLSRIFGLETNEPKKSEKEIFHIKDVRIEEMGFTMKDYGSEKAPYYGGINWNDLDIRNIDLTAHELMFKGGIMTGSVDHLSFREKSGYMTEKMSGSAKVGRGKAIINDLHIDDPWSIVQLPLFMMSFNHTDDFQDFINLVKLDAEIAPSSLDFKTLNYFAPQLEGNSLKLGLSGKISGYVSDFEMSDISVASKDGGFAGVVNGRMTGIPEIEDTRINGRVSKLTLTSDGLGKFLNEWTKDTKLDLSPYAKGYTFFADAKIKGLLNSMNINASVTSFIGSLNADIRLDNAVDENKPTGIRGTASTQNLDLGKILASDMLGPVTMRTGLEASLGEHPSVEIDSIFVDRLSLNKYDYSGIMGVGRLDEKMFNGKLVVSDPNVNLIVQGAFALSAKTMNSRYEFYANVSDADLNAINVDKRGKSKIRFQTRAEFTRTGDDNILGEINIADLIFENKDGVKRIGDINLTSDSHENLYKIRLKSQFADGSYTGTAPITEFIKDIREVTITKEAPALFADSEFSWKGNSYNFDFNTHDSMNLMAFIMPGAYINSDSKVNISIDSEGRMKASLNSKRLAIGSNYIKDVSLTADNLEERVKGELSVQELQFAGFRLGDNNMNILVDDNHIGAGYSFDNKTEKVYKGELVMNAGLSRRDDLLNIDLSFLPSAIYLNAKEWRIQPSSIRIEGRSLAVDSLEIISGDERIHAFGSTSAAGEDTLTLGLDRFDISILNPLLGSNLGIRGAATGNIEVTSPLKSRGLLADMLIDSTFIAGAPLGTVTLGSAWNEDFNRFDIRLSNEMKDKRNIDVMVKYTPKSRMFEGRASLDSLSVKYAEPFMTGIFSEMSGYISGDIMAEGPIDLLEIRSRGTRLEDAMLKVEFTNVPYYAAGDFSLDDNGVYFNDIQLKDRFNGTGSVNGSINWNRFKDMTFDTHLKVNAIEAVNLAKDQNESFYGSLYGTGNIAITGPINSLTMDIDAATAKTGQLHIPMSSSVTSVGTTNLLRFKEVKTEVYVDPYEEMRAKLAKEENSSSDLAVKLRVEATPNVEAFVEIDEATGNVLSGRGSGVIGLDISNDVFNINGDYTISSGKYNFSALGLVNREFDIQNGSSINFSGDIMASTLNIDAMYATKTSLGPLLADDKSVANRRSVECIIHITERLSNPRLAFDIKIPDLNPMIQSRVESALSTEDKKQKQFLSLLISNSFLPDEQSGIVNNTSMLYSNVSEAMANQLSNILHKLDIPLDLGLKYQPTEQGTDLFDVAVSTQLFNNRVVVNGNIGNKEYSSEGTQNDVVGDLDIEIKLNRAGAFRLNLFSHSADLYSNYLDNTQRNGVGLTYQTEFNSMGQFFRNMFMSKKKREKARLAEQEAALNGEKIEMKITKEDKDGKR